MQAVDDVQAEASQRVLLNRSQTSSPHTNHYSSNTTSRKRSRQDDESDAKNDNSSLSKDAGASKRQRMGNLDLLSRINVMRVSTADSTVIPPRASHPPIRLDLPVTSDSSLRRSSTSPPLNNQHTIPPGTVMLSIRGASNKATANKSNLSKGLVSTRDDISVKDRARIPHAGRLDGGRSSITERLPSSTDDPAQRLLLNKQQSQVTKLQVPEKKGNIQPSSLLSRLAGESNASASQPKRSIFERLGVEHEGRGQRAGPDGQGWKKPRR